MALAPGARLGPYEILAPLGAGGMREVYRARDTRLERTVAIKILPSQFSSDPVRKQRFEREAKTTPPSSVGKDTVVCAAASTDNNNAAMMGMSLRTLQNVPDLPVRK